MPALEGIESVDRFSLEPSRQSSTEVAFPIEARPLALPIEFAEKAIEAFDEDLPPTPEQYETREAVFRSALLLIDNGDYKSAQTLLRNVLAQEPHHVRAIEWMGYCLAECGDLENAAKCFFEWTKLEQTQASFVALGEVLFKLANFAEAEVWFKRALKLIELESPLLFKIHKYLGNISLQAGDLDAAEEFYNKAYILNSHSDVLYVNLGTLELQRGNMDIALDRYREAVRLNAQNEKAWIGVGLIHREKGDIELARANIEKALDIDAKNFAALRLYVDWSLRDGESAKALERIEKYFSAGGEGTDATLLLLEVLFTRGDFDRCRWEVERLKAFAPERPESSKWEKLMGAYS